MSNLFEKLANLSPEQRALFEQRLRDQGLTLPTTNRILPRSRSTRSEIPLSYAQQRLWFVQAFEPENTAYNVSAALRLNGPLDRQKLDRAIQKIIQRHEALRTSFHKNAAGKPIQRIHEPDPQSLPFRDLSQNTGAEQKAREEIAHLANQPFDLATPPLRFLLLKLTTDEHLLALAAHHLVCDRWSVMIFIRELAHYYASGASALPDLPIHYADWALWQQEQLHGETLQDQLTYWRGQLTDPLPQLSLPTKSGATHASHRGQHVRLVFDSELADGIRQLANQSQSSLFILLLSAFKVLLYHYDGGPDIVVGSEVANRDRPETAGLIGLLVNTIVLRTDLSGAPSFRELLERVRDTVLGGLHHQELPFEKLVETLNPDRDLNQLTPLFQVKFDLQQISISQTRFGELAFAPFPTEETQTKYALRLNLQEDAKGIRGQIEFSTDLFDTAAIKRLSQHYKTLLQNIVAHPDQRIDRLELISTREQEQLIRLGTGPQRPPVETTLHELFETQCESTPNALALIDGETELTYHELKRLADGYAERLCEQGIRSGTRVGVCLPKSADLVAALFAILKTGAAYVPLDPDYPEERLQFIINDAQCAGLFTKGQGGTTPGPRAEFQLCPFSDFQTRRDDVTPNPSESPIAPVSIKPKAGLKTYDTADLEVCATPLAYLIYTSGSTGHPKGVAISHNAAAEMVRWAGTVYSTEELSGVLVSTSISFDLSIFEIFVPLAHGGAVILADNLLTLSKLPSRNRVSLLNTVPSLLRQLLHSTTLPQSIQTINLAGEALPSDLVADIHKRGIAKIYNLYGPSEDTTYSTFTSLHQGEFDPATETVNIGRPIDNTHAFVLNASQRLVPVGVTGELYLGGHGLANGYWERSDLTENAFVANPLGKSPTRLYRTGDKVRWREDGQLEFLGRLDHQFKIRGFRIEAGEIEAILRGHSQVEDVLVIAHHDRGEAQLLAYIVPTDDPAENLSQQLRRYLSDRLPSAMVPSLWHPLDVIPRLPNGKVDRAKLPRPTKPSPPTEYTAPRTNTERQLTATWAKLLNQKRVGIHDNFFDLGGHSLLAIQLVTQLETQFSVTMPLRTLFERATVASLAPWLDDYAADLEQVPPEKFHVHTDSESRYDPFPLTDIQQAYWLGRNGAFELGNIATHGYREIDTKGIPHSAITEGFNRLIRRHDMLRAIVQPDGMQRVLEVVPEFTIQITQDIEHDLNHSPHCKAARNKLSHQVFDTSTWPLFHIEAVAGADERTRYFVSFDVIIGDAWSLQILGREMKQLLMGNTLPPLTLRFRDYVVAERTHREGRKTHESWQHWETRIPKLPSAPELPLVQSPVGLEAPEVVRRSAQLTSAQWTVVKQKAGHHRLTYSALVLAAFAEVLGTWSRKRHFTLNLTLFNRHPVHPEIDSIVGDFTSSTLIPCDQRSEQSFVRQASELQSTLWDSLEHRSVSGVRIIRELARQNNTGIGAVMPVVFTSTLGKMTTSNGHEEWEAKVVFGLSQTSQVYLDHQVSEIDGRLILNWDCIESLWPPGVLDAMFRAYHEFLIALSEDDTVWDTAPCLASLEPYNELNAPTRDRNSQVCATSGELLHGLFLKQAESSPNAPAIITDDREFTYGELAHLAIDLATQIQEHHVRPNELVAIGIPKGWQQIPACLGIQIAGAAYIPIDVTLPSKRRQQILADTKARLILTSAHSPSDWPDTLTQINVSAPPQPRAHALQTIPEPQPDPTDLAYVIYTSGSTGKPKGVMIDHRGAVNTILDINKRINLHPQDRVFALSSLNFDLSVYDIFGTLAVGAAIVIGSDSSRHDDPGYWIDRLLHGRATIWNSVPALAQLLADALSNHNTKAGNLALRSLLLSGDWIPMTLPEALKKHFPQANVISLGGATEASIWSIIHPITHPTADWPSIPYGVPMQNQQWFVLDVNGRPRPPWVPGELYIGGLGVAKGYWRRPQLTAERFLPSPMANNESDVVYRTGDWGRLRPANNTSDAPLLLEFLGREDFQVKINGYRIELGEIEAALIRHNAIEQAAVTAIDTELIAYLVPASSSLIPFQKLQTKTEPKQTRGPEIPLPDIPGSRPPFRRQTHRRFQDIPLHLQTLAKFLEVLRPVHSARQPIPKYHYPSAGGLYPVDTYLSVKPDRILGLPGGWYRFEAKSNQLVPIEVELPTDDASLYPVNENVFEQSVFTCFFIADLDRIQSVYGDRSRDFCLLECGYIGQLLMESAPDHNLGLCPANEKEFEFLPNRLQLGSTNTCLHALIGGPIDQAWSQEWKNAEQMKSQSFLEKLETHLREQLPAYMIPRRFQILDSLPLSANGKIDRSALPIPNQSGGSEYTPPRNDLDRQIIELWKQLLGRERVGIHDDFFNLGGNSLLAIQLLGQLRTQIAPNLTMAQLFGALTPAKQAELIRSLADTPSEANPIVPVAREETPLEHLSDDDVTAQLEHLLKEKDEES